METSMRTPDFEPLLHSLRQFRSTLTSESDRGCALMAAAYLDDKVSELIQSHLLDRRRIVKKMFGPLGPWGSFSSRIDSAYLLGLISATERQDLHLIRDIRNRFGHVAAPINFESAEVALKCHSLQLNAQPTDAPPRRFFEQSTMGLAARLDRAIVRAVRPTELEPNPPSKEAIELHQRMEKDWEEVLENWLREGVTAEEARRRTAEFFSTFTSDFAKALARVKNEDYDATTHPDPL